MTISCIVILCYVYLFICFVILDTIALSLPPPSGGNEGGPSLVTQAPMWGDCKGHICIQNVTL